MTNTGKAILATLGIGAGGAVITLGILYASCSSAVTSLQTELDKNKEDLAKANEALKNNAQQNMLERLMDSEGLVDDLKKSGTDQQKTIIELTEQVNRLKEEITIYKNKAWQFEATSKEQEAKIKALEAKIAELETRIIDYFLNKTENCQWHYSSVDKRYGKVCYGEGIENGLWFTAHEETEVGAILKKQFESAPEESRFIDGVSPKKR